MSTIHKQLLAVGVLVSLGLTACSGSGTSPANTTESNLPSNVLQFSVGTANLYGTFTGLNVATTYRQPKGAFHPGDSAVFVSSPSLTGPFAMPAVAGSPDGTFSTINGPNDDGTEAGPAPGELNGHTMGSTTQNGSTVSTFGTSGGVVGLGIEPFNYNLNGVPDTTTPYTQPLYDQLMIPSGGGPSVPDPNTFVPWGGQPAFPAVPSGAAPFISEGLDIFAVKPSTGAYTLSVVVPANTGNFTKTGNAAIGNLAPLPTFTSPTPTLDGNGGGSLAVTLPAGVTEAYVQVIDVGPPNPSSNPSVGSCNGAANGAIYYTFFVTHSGATKIPDTINGSPTICTAAQNSGTSGTTAGDDFLVQAIGFDYPWYEASYPNSLGNPNPVIDNGGGQSDVTVSTNLGYEQASGSGGDSVHRVSISRSAIKKAVVRHH